ncbi:MULTISPECIES: hypothetical protein [Oceanimonas]|uniref:Uncharacterized protein n=1 Tax=Oceanimonas doudoroffii TaxID=84158 RepID=A0A233REV4_9GAMM|nr:MULTISPECIES: hypothetical protein [Oceanimonas]NHI01413.1 hypothetical protein [Oceanimonas sp. MB9]OXY81897.1 hypothetical protein B6S08_10635 [Oceanimonas doudoroffii]
MAKVISVLVQGVGYHWNGQDILVDDGISAPWPLAGPVLDGVELYNQEGEASGTFTIDFERQDWLLAGESDLGAVLLVDEKGAGLSPLSPLTAQAMRLPPPALSASNDEAAHSAEALTLDDILLSSELPDLFASATITDTAALNSDLIDDVINWLSVYSPPE